MTRGAAFYRKIEALEQEPCEDAISRIESEISEDTALAEKILDFIEENYPTELTTSWEWGFAYALDEIEKICRSESEESNGRE